MHQKLLVRTQSVVSRKNKHTLFSSR